MRKRARDRSAVSAIQSFSSSAFPSDDCQALAALEPAGLDDLAATTGGHAGAIADLAGALLAVRAECGLHDFGRKRGSEVPDAAGSVKGVVLEVVVRFEVKM